MLHDRIKELRKTTGLSANKFAASIGMKYTTYYGYETGAREPGADFIKDMAEMFGVTTDYILGRDTTTVSTQISPSCSQKNLNANEQKMIKKYRTLDEHGIDMVDTVLEKEYTRVVAQQQQENDQPKEEKPKVYRIPVAARGGGVSYVEQTQEEHDKAEKLIREKYPELLGKSNID